MLWSEMVRSRLLRDCLRSYDLVSSLLFFWACFEEFGVSLFVSVIKIVDSLEFHAILFRILLAYGEFCIVTILFLPASDYPIYQWINGLLFQFWVFLAYSSHIKTMLTDPVSLTGFGTLEGRAQDQVV